VPGRAARPGTISVVASFGPNQPPRRFSENKTWRFVMCLTCGCMKPHDDHGKSGYLLIDDLERSAKNDDLKLDDAVKNLVKTVDVAKKEQEHRHV
jgi:hypothetical protein